MDEKKITKDEVLYHAHRCMYFNEKMIEQCDSWLSAEEGNENMMRSIKKNQKSKKNKINNIFKF